MAEVNGAYINNNCVPGPRLCRGFVAILFSQLADQLLLTVNSREIELFRVKILAPEQNVTT